MILLILSTIPAVIFALLFKDVINLLASKLWVVGLLLIINGCILLTITRIVGFRKREELNYKDALVIGCFQCLGILPGISRSGSCLSGAFTRKIEKETAQTMHSYYSFCCSFRSNGIRIGESRKSFWRNKQIDLLYCWVHCRDDYHLFFF